MNTERLWRMIESAQAVYAVSMSEVLQVLIGRENNEQRIQTVARSKTESVRVSEE